MIRMPYDAIQRTPLHLLKFVHKFGTHQFIQLFYYIQTKSFQFLQHQVHIPENLRRYKRKLPGHEPFQRLTDVCMKQSCCHYNICIITHNCIFIILLTIMICKMPLLYFVSGFRNSHTHVSRYNTCCHK